MDGHRSYPDDLDPRWRQDGRGYDGPDREHHEDTRGVSDPRYGEASGYGEPRPGGPASYGGGPGYSDHSGGVPSGDPSPGGIRSDPLTGDLPSDVPGSPYPGESRDLGQLRRGPAGPSAGVGQQRAPGVQNSPHLRTAPPDRGPAPSPQATGLRVPPGMTHDTGPLPTVAAPAGSPPASVYRTKRTGLAIALIIATGLTELLMLRGFAASAFGAKVSINGTISSLLMIIGLPFFALGCYAAFGGAAAAPGQGARVWFRTPLAYLPLAVAIFLAAAVAAR
ncbi:MAG: hypothetical protein HKP61_03105 [Dactylosporangium sp.]|nr:hypothetical protein [Dactylosporangium sp.]NNJ59943.1 hypothetical protein [Dactylosporangium sp.]